METVNLGLNASDAQSAAWKRLDSEELAPWLLATMALDESGAQLVGLNMNLDRSMTTLTALTSSGMPCKIVGSGSLVIVICAVCGSALIVARTATLPRLNGPATAGTTISRPNGAPL